jgi:hypothetical protein
MIARCYLLGYEKKYCLHRAVSGFPSKRISTSINNKVAITQIPNFTETLAKTEREKIYRIIDTDPVSIFRPFLGLIM